MRNIKARHKIRDFIQGIGTNRKKNLKKKEGVRGKGHVIRGRTCGSAQRVMTCSIGRGGKKSQKAWSNSQCNRSTKTKRLCIRGGGGGGQKRGWGAARESKLTVRNGRRRKEEWKSCGERTASRRRLPRCPKEGGGGEPPGTRLEAVGLGDWETGNDGLCDWKP